MDAEHPEGPFLNAVVMVCYYFPPLVGIASERAAAFARHLPEAGWDPIVVAPRRGFFHRADEPPQASAVVVRTRNPELSRLLRRGFTAATGTRPDDGGIVVPVPTAAGGAALRRFAREVLYVPDAQLAWIPFAGRAAARELARLPERSVLFSTSVPYSAHFAAMWARRRRRTPWVAEFRDPWSEAHTKLRPASPARRRLDRSMHQGILRAATRVVVTSTGLRARLLAVFPELDPDRVDVVMNGFEPGPAGTTPEPGQPLQILYAGTVASGEDVGPILQATEMVHARNPGRLRLTIVGPPGDWRGRVDNLAPWLELKGLHTPEQARLQMRDASALFLLQSHEAYADTLPGKLLEYVGARRPILAAVPESWSMVEVLRAHSDVRLAPNIAEALASQIERLLAEHAAGELQRPRVPEEVVQPLGRREQTKRLAEVFARALASERPAPPRPVPFASLA
jgi:hypothetical protein